MSHFLTGATLLPARDAGKGTRMAALYTGPHGDMTWFVNDVRPVFEPTAYGGVADAARVTLCLRADEDMKNMMEAIENFFFREVTAQNLLGDCDIVAVKARYQSAMKQNDKYGAQLRVKVNLAGPYAARFWDANKQPRGAPESWRDSSLRCVLKVRGIYMTGTTWGPIVELTDAQVTQEASAITCPF